MNGSIPDESSSWRDVVLRWFIYIDAVGVMTSMLYVRNVRILLSAETTQGQGQRMMEIRQDQNEAESECQLVQFPPLPKLLIAK